MAAEIIAIASDHAGFEYKDVLKRQLTDWGYEVLDLGTDSTASVDYPDFGKRLARAVAEGKVRRGVIICGTGIGISIAANREPKVRAALCHDATSARLARQHNDANVLSIGARVIGVDLADEIVDLFLSTDFEGGRHARRVAMLTELEETF
jgi:ribose 5-phosphate isomerase B